jgi:hypothetical protein
MVMRYESLHRLRVLRAPNDRDEQIAERDSQLGKALSRFCSIAWICWLSAAGVLNIEKIGPLGRLQGDVVLLSGVQLSNWDGIFRDDDDWSAWP